MLLALPEGVVSRTGEVSFSVVDGVIAVPEGVVYSGRRWCC